MEWLGVPQELFLETTSLEVTNGVLVAQIVKDAIFLERNAHGENGQKLAAVHLVAVADLKGIELVKVLVVVEKKESHEVASLSVHPQYVHGVNSNGVNAARGVMVEGKLVLECRLVEIRVTEGSRVPGHVILDLVQQHLT
jgi:hypothetical protein